ncbi:periplasmic chaperone for outer membrane proteins SurA [Parapedobacter koreensis]|uniref:Periplasmic chaperone for outer membrane proteins SurA n=2 Tax=Parapedobacter koreensis TaxID=332977 RepID=A0A1H7SAH9_9SPHI|nr:peptidylprolyl isomerase [Parapedobacter koreensis]SEL69620.1 periplasmic chaperone for outer membrane proteins SurA [Parapedobacter koreensis]
MSRHSCIFLILAIVGASNLSMAQQAQVIDKVAAMVGSNIILQSEIEMQYAQYLAQGNKADEDFKCYILQQQLTQKLLAQQAAIDSIDVGESEVDDNINSRLRYMSSQAGGQERLERFLNRSLLQYKEEMRPSVYEQLKANKMQQNIVSGIDVTPLEVKRYFESLEKDSLPYFNTEVEVGELVVYPQLTREEKQQYRDRAEELRKQIADGADFATIARLYSQDGGSAPYGGDLGFSTRDRYVKEFSAVAFRLKPGELSQVFESEHGFHFLEVLERRGEEARVRHILIQIKPTQASLDRAKKHIDSIYENVAAKKLDFYTAATLYSDNKETKYNGGMLLNMENQQSRTTLIPADKLDASVFTAIDTLQPGQYSRPASFTDQTNKTGYRFTYLKSRTAPHQANLEQDFAKIKEAALDDKINRKLSEWFEGRRKVTFININDAYYDCDDLKIWLKDSGGEAVAQQ